MKILKEPRTASELELEVRFEFSKFFRDTMHYLQEDKRTKADKLRTDLLERYKGVRDEGVTQSILDLIRKSNWTNFDHLTISYNGSTKIIESNKTKHLTQN